MITIESRLFKYGSYKETVKLEFETHEDVVNYINRSLELTEYNAEMSDLYEDNCHSKYCEKFTYNGTDYHLEMDC